MKKIALFAGSFNPLHKGHINIIKRAAALFDTLYVAISINTSKKNANLNESFNNVDKEIKKLKLSNVKVLINKGLVVDFAKKYHCKYLVRAIRNIKDAAYELNMTINNYYLDKNIETVLFVADQSLKKISSSSKLWLIKEKNKFDKNE